MADHLGDVADSVGPVGGRVTQVRHAAASAQRIVACMTNEHFWCDEFGHPDYARAITFDLAPLPGDDSAGLVPVRVRQPRCPDANLN